MTRHHSSFGNCPSFALPDDDETYSWAMSSHEDSEASYAEQDEQHTLTMGKAETGGWEDGVIEGFWDDTLSSCKRDI